MSQDHQQRQDPAEDDFLPQVGEGVLHEASLGGHHRHPDVGKLGLELVQGSVDPLGHGHGVGTGVLIYDESHCGAPVELDDGAGVGGGEGNGGDVVERDAALRGADRCGADFLRRAELGEGTHRETELTAADGAAGGGGVGGLDGARNIVGREAEGAHPRRIDVHPDFVLRRAHHRHAGHTFQLLEPSGEHLLRGPAEGAEVAGTRQREDRDRALAGVAGEEGGAGGLFGEETARVVQPLAHREHRRRHVGAPGEARGGGQLTRSGDGAQLDQAGRGGNGLLDRLGHEAADFGGGRAREVGADGEDRQGDVRQERHRQAPERHAAEEDQPQHRGDGGDGAPDGGGGEAH